eukprot:TRINITY_DN2351_c1_g1_i1.p1 TRINITY_DN2351_c1_g1~~TRINITY_DN2351_c1_g1_i1.p1  ORF type:complete len:658 (+),score=144.22 TRINITY_DN2351_c1_g1_i1:72-1976(+)
MPLTADGGSKKPSPAPSPVITYRGTPLREALRTPPGLQPSLQSPPPALHARHLSEASSSPRPGGVDILGCIAGGAAHVSPIESPTISAAGANRDARRRLGAAVRARAARWHATGDSEQAPLDPAADFDADDPAPDMPNDASAESAAMWAALRSRLASAMAARRRRASRQSDGAEHLSESESPRDIVPGAARGVTDECIGDGKWLKVGGSKPAGSVPSPAARRIAATTAGGTGAFVTDTLREWSDNPLYHDPVMRGGYAGQWIKHTPSYTTPQKYSSIPLHGATVTAGVQEPSMLPSAADVGLRRPRTYGRTQSAPKKGVRTGPGKRAKSASSSVPSTPLSVATPAPAPTPPTGMPRCASPMHSPPPPAEAPPAADPPKEQPPVLAAALGHGFDDAGALPDADQCPLSPAVEVMLARRAKAVHSTPAAGPQTRSRSVPCPRRPSPQPPQSAPMRPQSRPRSPPPPPPPRGSERLLAASLGCEQGDGSFGGDDWRPARRRTRMVRHLISSAGQPSLSPGGARQPPHTAPARPRSSSSAAWYARARRHSREDSGWRLEDDDCPTEDGAAAASSTLMGRVQEGVIHMAQAVASADGKAKRILDELTSPLMQPMSPPTGEGHRKRSMSGRKGPPAPATS